MKGKKAWIRIVEAFIAAMLILIILLSLYSRPASQKSLEEIEKIIDASLNEVVNDNQLRQDILNNQTDDIKLFLRDRIPDIMNFSVKICDVEDVCSLDVFHEEVIARERIVSSTLQEYSPKKIRIFVWEE